MRYRDEWFRVGFILALVFGAFLFVYNAARADWDGETSPEIEAWFRKQTNAIGDVCCDKTEVTRVSDYRFDGKVWIITVDGIEYHATPEKTTEHPNIMGVPIAWFYPRFADRSDDTLRCFMRGTEG